MTATVDAPTSGKRLMAELGFEAPSTILGEHWVNVTNSPELENDAQNLLMRQSTLR